MSPEEVLRAFELRKAQRKLFNYLPYGHPDTLCPDGKRWKEMNALNEHDKWVEWSNKPWQLEFHNVGADFQERMLKTGNREGKTYTAAAETAFHMTGLYPDWWEGRRFTHPVLVWTGSPTNETSRDIVQRELLGGLGESLGTGMIPRECLIGKPKSKQAGISDVVDSFKVRHVSGGESTCILKTYEQGWRKWQGTAPHVVWMDEEPEDNDLQGKIYSEARTRIITSNGIIMVTFTPLLGNTKLVMRFMENIVGGRYLIEATWDDVPHLNDYKRGAAQEGYDEEELDTRTKGVPMMGEGRIFTVREDEIVVEPFQIPNWWVRINGIDFGLDHPFALARIAYDRDADIIYLYETYRKSKELPAIHAQRIRAAGDWIPVAWPHDGAKRSIQSGGKEGIQLKNIYKALGVNMLHDSARYEDDKKGPQPVWPIIEEIKERERSGRFKVFKNCHEYLEERRVYHTKDNKIIDKRDDTLKACFYAVMMIRKARSGFQKKTNQLPSSPIMSVRI